VVGLSRRRALGRRATPADTVPVARGGWLECLPDSAIASRLNRDARLIVECIERGEYEQAQQLSDFSAPYRAEARRRLGEGIVQIPS